MCWHNFEHIFKKIQNFKIEFLKVWHYEHIKGLTNFSFWTQFLQFFGISNKKIHSKNQYFPHLNFENYEIISIKFDSSKVFQQQQEHFQFPMQFLVLILFNFH